MAIPLLRVMVSTPQRSQRLAGGCHLTRKIAETIEQAGFIVEQLDTYYFKGEPKLFAYTFEGRGLRR